jgi:hypothetical protein
MFNAKLGPRKPTRDFGKPTRDSRKATHQKRNKHLSFKMTYCGEVQVKFILCIFCGRAPSTGRAVIDVRSIKMKNM